MADKKKIAVLRGGTSAERQVSLMTGRQIVDALDKTKYDVTEMDTADLPRLATLQDYERPDVVFIALHGPGGEDGAVQGFLEVLGIPYTGSGVLASSLAMDKARSKTMIAAANIPVPAQVTFEKHDAPRRRRAPQEIAQGLGFPVVIKPSRQGSSYGTTIVLDDGEVAEALSTAFRYDTTVLVEQKIEGTEITVAVLGNREPYALPVVEIVAKDGFFDYESKYSTGESGATEIVPARISPADQEEAQKIAVECHVLFGCRGMSRTDMFVTDDGAIVLEINTIPGMTATSLLPKAAQAAGVPFPLLLDGLIAYALEKP